MGFEIVNDAMVTILGYDFYVVSVDAYGTNDNVFVSLVSVSDSESRTMACVKRSDIFIG